MTTTYAPSGPPASPSAPPHADATAVLGKRFAAFAIDTVVLFAVVVGMAMALWEHAEITDGFDDGEAYCDALVDAADFGGECIAFPADTPVLGDYVYLVDTSDQIIQSVVPFAVVIANLVLLQGLTGASVGKLITGLRVVNPSGQVAGIGPSAVRTVLWVVDGAPWIFPLVGPITAVTTNGHRRVGDMAASTYVVARSAVGTPVTATAAVPPAEQTAWGAAPAPAAPDQATAASTPPAEPPESGAPAAPAGAETTASGEQPRPAPRWDEARNTYLQWDPDENGWLQWDGANERWKPIDS